MLALTAPPKDFGLTPLTLVRIDPSALVRVTRHSSGEPYFGQTGAMRFDDYRKPAANRFGTCYLGTTLSVAVAETILHNEIPIQGKFSVSTDSIRARRVVSFTGNTLILADLTGAALKRSGADSSLSSIADYALPQKWSVAIHGRLENVDGFVYMSRHLNTHQAVVLFDRAKSKMSATSYLPLDSHPELRNVLSEFGIEIFS